MSVWSEATALAKRAAADLTAVVNRILFLENITIHSALDVNTDYENKDPTTGRFKTITHKRVDGTVIRRTTYEIDPDEPAEVPPKLNLKVVTVFAKDGITILQETRYRVAYDSDGDIVSETVLSD